MKKKNINLKKGNYIIENKDKLIYKQEIEKSKLIQLLQMTPLSWSRKKQDWDTIEYSKISSITVDLMILTGKVAV